MNVPVAYSIPAAAKAFSPPISLRAIRGLVREGVFKTVTIARRKYIIRDELIEALRELSASNPERN